MSLLYQQLSLILNIRNNPYDAYCFHYEDPGVRIYNCDAARLVITKATEDTTGYTAVILYCVIAAKSVRRKH